MKNYKIYILFFVLLAVFSSCEKEDDEPIRREQYLGEWLCAETGGISFTINITAHGAADTILIENFSGYGSSLPKAMAVVSGNSMNIPSQNITTTSINIYGTGVMNSTATKITMNYHADGTEINATCTR